LFHQLWDFVVTTGQWRLVRTAVDNGPVPNGDFCDVNASEAAAAAAAVVVVNNILADEASRRAEGNVVFGMLGSFDPGT
jgi:ABC-type uncharacterized transport system YnjBCD substrate-binding protein